MKQVWSGILAILLVFGLLAPVSAESSAGTTYRGKTLMVVNHQLDTKMLYEGSFNGHTALFGETEEIEEEIFDTYVDPFSGQQMTVTAPKLELVPSLGSRVDNQTLQLQEEKSYSVGETKVLNIDYNYLLESKNMRCLYIGEYCTVWGTTDDDKAIQIQSTHAAEIGESFDSHYEEFAEAFGGYWFDADGDGKVALMCYDIGNQYDPNGTDPYSYTGGYFSDRDMISENNEINGHRYQPGYYLNGMDLVHIDTYPGMGTMDYPLQNVSRSYSTVIHEFQHMVNFSYTVVDELSAKLSNMETFMNEAFSMAAEYLVFGFDAISSRISFFNNDEYVQGTSLTCWNETLSSYANSFLFGQYLRAQYGLLHGTDGSELFQDFLSARLENNSVSSMEIAADLLQIDGTEPERQLVENFWKALYLKEKTGPYGFGGEPWADNIYVKLSALDGETGGIYNGGVKYYALPEAGHVVTNSENVIFVELDTAYKPQSEIPEIHSIKAERLNGSTGQVLISLKQPGYIYFKYYRTAMSYVRGSYRVGGAFSTVTIPVNNLADQNKAYEFIYWTTNLSGTEKSEERTITIPVELVSEQPLTECGKTLDWELDEHGVLSIWGNGPMYDFSSEKNQPWAKQRDQIKEIVIGPGVSAIGDHAFEDCGAVATIRLPNSLASIGDDALEANDDHVVRVEFAGSKESWKKVAGSDELDEDDFNLVFASADQAIVWENGSLFVESKSQVDFVMESDKDGYALVSTYDENGRMIECGIVKVKKGYNHASISLENSDLTSCDLTMFLVSNDYIPADEAASLSR